MADGPAEVIDFMQLAAEADAGNRAEGLEDLRFRFGDQWPAYIANMRRGTGPIEDRPCLTINETDSYVRQMENHQRQQRPRIKASPIDNHADPKIAEVISGLTRHVEENSDASNAYDIACSFQITMGWGYWRLRTDYIREDSFNQDIFIDPVENPFTVSFDPNSSLPDGSDAEKAAITDMMRKDAFRIVYPGAQEAGIVQSSTGDVTTDWVREHDIRLAEFFKVEREKARLVMLSSGAAMYEDALPPLAILKAANLTVTGDRMSYKRKVTWQKVSAFEVLEERVLPGRWIPVVPVYGMTLFIDGKRKRMGAVRFAKDPQRMVNYWQTAITESIAMGPKAKWMMVAGQDEGFENEWAQANQSSKPILHWLTQVEGAPPGLPAPQRIQPEPPPEGAIMAAMGASQNLQRVLGIYDPGVRSGSHKSDRTINAESQQTEITNFHFYGNFTRSLKHTGRIILDWTPKVWDTQRVQRIIGDDGQEKLITLNEKKTGQNATGQAIEQVLNDVTVGTFDVIMETGPGYNSKRQEAVAMLTEILGTPLGEKIAAVADDVLVRLMDFPGADVVADRLAAANPLSQIDEESEIPPQAQMMIKGLQQKVQQLMQALQQAGIEIKFGLQKEGIKQDGATKRTLLQETGKAHNVEQTANFKQHDTEVRALTAQNVEEIRALALLLSKHLDTGQLREEIAARDREQAAKAGEEEPVAQ